MLELSLPGFDYKVKKQNGTVMIFDIVVFDRSGNPWLLVECKAPAVALTQKVFDQVFRYNLTLAAPYVAITNGVRHFCGYMNQENDFCFLDDFPEFSQERELLA